MTLGTQAKIARARDRRTKEHIPQCEKYEECRKGLKKDLSCKKGKCNCYQKPTHAE